MNEKRYRRRTFLASACAVAVGATSGCLGRLTSQGPGSKLDRNDVSNAGSGAGSVPMHQVGADHAGFTGGTRTADSGDRRWVSTVHPPDIGHDVVLGQRSAIVVGKELGLCALDASDGALQWHSSLSDVLTSAPALATDVVVLATATLSDDTGDSGEVRAYDITDGSEVWQSDTVPPSATQPTVHGEHVYVSGDFESRAVSAHNLDSGDRDWAVELDGEPGPLAVSDAGVVVQTSSSLYVLDPTDGSTVWQTTAGASAASVPTVADGTLYVSPGEAAIAAVSIDSGDREWTIDAPGDSTVSIAVADGSVYAASDRALLARDGDDGSMLWRRGPDDVARAVDSELGTDAKFRTVAVTNDAVYVGFGLGLLAVEREDGRVLWYEQFRSRTKADVTYGGSPGAPAVGDDTVYAYTTGGDLYAVAR